jgi:Fic family protein
MRWSWQQPEWPNFSYDAAALSAAEGAFLKGAGVIVGSLRHLDGDAQRGLTIEFIASEMIESSAIEGEHLDRASVQSSIARQLGFRADPRRANAAESGAAELMTDLYRHYADPLSDDLLFRWHAMLMYGRRDLTAIGAYRTHADPMQIISGVLHAPKVHFEAPASADVPAEMAQLLAWFNTTSPSGSAPLPALTRAALAHLWFEILHPFEDGNGRLGRALAEKALAQSVEAPTLTALAATIHRHRKDYYAELQIASQSLEIDRWMKWFADRVLEAQQRTIRSIEFVIAKAKLFDQHRDRLNPRQEKALRRMMDAGIDGFIGGLSAENYRRITDATTATTTRDLADMVAMGALRREGERRYTRYYLPFARLSQTAD